MMKRNECLPMICDECGRVFLNDKLEFICPDCLEMFSDLDVSSSENIVTKEDWENTFRSWCAKHSKCDYGAICEFCTDSRSCIKALTEYMDYYDLKIDYGSAKAKEVFYGTYWEDE